MRSISPPLLPSSTRERVEARGADREFASASRSSTFAKTADFTTSLFPEAQALEARQHFVAKERELREVIDEGEAHAGETGRADLRQRPRHVVGIADHWEAAMAGGEADAERLEELRRIGLRVDLVHADEVIDRLPVAHLFGVIAVILLGLAARLSADDIAIAIDADLAAEGLGLGLGLLHLLHARFERAQGAEQHVARSGAEGAAGGRG